MTARQLTLVPLLLCLALPLEAIAEERLYWVEAIVFARDGDSYEEVWPDNLALRYPENARRLAEPDAEQEVAPDATGTDGAIPTNAMTPPLWQPVKANEQKLRDAASIVARQQGTRVLFHERWLQPAQYHGRPAPIAIEGGSRYGSYHELTGYLTLRAGRFLHFQPDVWLASFVRADGPEATPEDALHLPEPPPRHRDERVSTRSLLEAEGGEREVPVQPEQPEAGPGYYPAQVIALQQSRRVRFAELHYFDHPRLGVIVQVTEYKPEQAEETAQVE